MLVINRIYKRILTTFFLMVLTCSIVYAKDPKMAELDGIRAVLAYSNPSNEDYIKNKEKLSKLIRSNKINYSLQNRFEDIQRLIKEAKYDCAIFEIKELIQANFEVSKCYEYYGDIYIKLNRDSSRIASCYKNSILADENNISAMYKLARLYLKEKRSIMGIQTLRNIVLKTDDLNLLNEIEYIVLNKIEPQTRYDSNNLYEMLGWIYQKQRKIDKALDVYNKALQLNPNDIFLKYYLADLYMYCDKKDEALKLYNEILLENKTDSQIRISKAKILTNEGNLSDAAKEYLNILNDYPNSAYAKYGVFKIYQAKATPGEILFKINKTTPNKDDCLNFAKFLYNLGDKIGANMFIEYSKTFDPPKKVSANPPKEELNDVNKNSSVPAKQAILPQGKKQEVEKKVNKNVNATPPKKEVKKEENKINKQQEKAQKSQIKQAEKQPEKKVEKAEKKVEKAEKKVEKQPEKKVEKKVEKQIDDTLEANISRNEKVIALERKKAIEKNSKIYNEQKMVLDKYLKMPNKDAGCLTAIANTYKQMGEYTISTLYYKEAIKKDPLNSDIYFNLALSYLEMNKTILAKENLLKAVNLDNENQKAQNMLAFVDQKIITSILNNAYEQFENKKYVEAFQLLDEGIKQYPSNAQLYYYRALVYIEMKRNAAAIIDLQKALEIDPSMYMAYYQLGIAYEKIKDERSALVAYERFLSTEPSEKDLVDAVVKKVTELGNKYY